MGKNLAADDVFLCFGLYGLIQYSTTIMVPATISYYAEGISSIQRIQVYMLSFSVVSVLFYLRQSQQVYKSSFTSRLLAALAPVTSHS